MVRMKQLRMELQLVMTIDLVRQQMKVGMMVGQRL
jgi:hypothetical protein